MPSCRRSPRRRSDALRDPIDVVKAALDGTPPPKPPPPPGPPRRPPGGGGRRRSVRPTAAPAARDGTDQLEVGAPRAATRRWPLLVAAADHHVRRWPTSSSTCPSPATSGPTRCRRSWPATAASSRKSFRRKATGSTSTSTRSRVHVRDAVMAAEDRDFYTNPGLLVHGLLPGVQEQHLRRRPAGRVDDHPAVRQERVGRRSQRAGLGGLVRKAKELVISTKMSRRVVQRPSAAGLSEHHLLRPRRLRHRARRPRRTSTSRSNSSPSPTVRCWPR